MWVRTWSDGAWVMQRMQGDPSPAQEPFGQTPGRQSGHSALGAFLQDAQQLGPRSPLEMLS